MVVVVVVAEWLWLIHGNGNVISVNSHWGSL